MGCAFVQPTRPQTGPSGSSSGDDAANSDSVPPASSPTPRRASWPSPTTSWRVPGATRSPRRAALTAFPPSPRPPSACLNEARRLARPVARAQLVEQPGKLRLPPHRPPPRLRGHYGRRAGDPDAHLARQRAETAWAVRQRIRSVLEWAIAMDPRNDNPCDRVLPVLGPQNDIVTHRPALPHKDVVAATETVRTRSRRCRPSGWRSSSSC